VPAPPHQSSTSLSLTSAVTTTSFESWFRSATPHSASFHALLSLSHRLASRRPVRYDVDLRALGGPSFSEGLAQSCPRLPPIFLQRDPGALFILFFRFSLRASASFAADGHYRGAVDHFFSSSRFLRRQLPV